MVKYVKSFQHPRSFGFTGSAKAQNKACGGMVNKAQGGPITKADVKLLNQVANQVAKTGRLPGVK